MMSLSFPRSAHVEALQRELRRLQLQRADEPMTPGLFDKATSAAVRRFQWFAAHVPGALDAAGAYVGRTPVELPRDGIVGPQTRRLLDQFSAHGWAATGLLVQLDLARFRHLRPAPGFAALLGGHPRLALCERGFVPVLEAIDRRAVELGLQPCVNRLFRAETDDAREPSAVPPPGSLCAHKIGRAVDLQAGPAAGLTRLGAHLTADQRCRHGADLDPADPAHFDRQVQPAGGERWAMHHFFDQLQYRQALRNPAALPEYGYGDAG